MNNFINTRLQAHNNTKIMNNIKHNLRSIKSLNTDLNSTSNNVCFINDKTYILNEENQKKLLQELKQQYRNDRLVHNEVFKKNNKRNLVDQGTWQEGVFTFSKQLVVDLKNGVYTLNDLSKVANDCLKDIAKAYGADIKAMFLHLDEKTPHFHFFITNFDKEKGFSLFNHYKKKEFLSGIQDIAAKHFSKLGMERGLSKEITSMNHKSINSYWRDKNIQIKQEHTNLKQISNELEEDISSLKLIKSNVLEELSDSKIERDLVKKDLTKSNEEKKMNYEKISNQQQLIRKQIKLINKIETSFSNLKKDIVKDTKDILENSKGTFSLDKEKLTKNIQKYLYKYSKTKFKFNDFKELRENLKNKDNEINKNKEHIQFLLNKISKLENELDQANELNLEKTQTIKDYMKREKEDRSFTNNEIINVTKKYENELRELNIKILNLEEDNSTLKNKVEKYEDYIKDNDLEEDFKDKNKSKNNSNKFGR